MTTIAVVYHSGYGHTHEQAKAVAEGAAGVPGTTVELIRIEPGADYAPIVEGLNSADAIIFGTPTYMGTVSGPFKMFMDASSKAWFTGAWKDKVAAGFTNSASQSGDKLNTLITLAVYAAQQHMIWVGPGLQPGNNSTTGSPEDLNRLGSSLGAMAQSPADAGADVGPSASDKKTAALLGQRVAEITRKLRG